MNNQSVNKLKLLLLGLVGRIEENMDYFESLFCVFKSGAREFVMSFSLNEDIFTCGYNGAVRDISLEELAGIILSECAKYDSVVITHSDRLGKLVLTADNKSVTSNIADSTKKNDSLQYASVGGREYIIKEDRAGELLKAIGIMAENGKIKNDMIRKYNQIDHFVELIADIPLGDGFSILDCACGKSYLSFVLNHYYTEIKKKKCMVYGVDDNQGVVEASMEMAKRLKYNNMKFLKADLNTFVPDKKPDFVVSLHACDTLTDYGIACGVKNKAKAIVCVPCCHKEISKKLAYEPFREILTHGIFKVRLANIFTDAMRVLLLEAAGYKASVVEYISPVNTPKNLMIKAVYTGKENKGAKEEYNALKEKIGTGIILEKLL